MRLGLQVRLTRRARLRDASQNSSRSATHPSRRRAALHCMSPGSGGDRYSAKLPAALCHVRSDEATGRLSLGSEPTNSLGMIKGHTAAPDRPGAGTNRFCPQRSRRFYSHDQTSASTETGANRPIVRAAIQGRTPFRENEFRPRKNNRGEPKLAPFCPKTFPPNPTRQSLERPAAV